MLDIAEAVLAEMRVPGMTSANGSRPEDARLAAIVKSSDDAIIAKDLNGVILSWNRAAERLFGYTASEVFGKPITIIFPPDRLEEEARFSTRLGVAKGSITTRLLAAVRTVGSSAFQRRSRPSEIRAARLPAHRRYCGI